MNLDNVFRIVIAVLFPLLLAVDEEAVALVVTFELVAPPSGISKRMPTSGLQYVTHNIYPHNITDEAT